MKKSQVTLFFIIGIAVLVIVAIFLGIVVSRNKKELAAEEHESLEVQADIIRKYVEQCLFEVTKKGIYLSGAQGGFIDPDYNEFYGDYDQVEYQRSGIIKIPYWYYNGVDISPTLQQVETKLGRYILIEAENCTNFEDMDALLGTKITKPTLKYQVNWFDLSKEETNIEVSINDDFTDITYYFPIVLEREDAKLTLEKFNTIIDIAYGDDFKIAKEVLSRTKNSNEEGYNIQEDCNDFNRGGYTNVFSFNSRILLIDYEPFFTPNYQKSFKFQYLLSGGTTYGYCSG